MSIMGNGGRLERELACKIILLELLRLFFDDALVKFNLYCSCVAQIEN